VKNIKENGSILKDMDKVFINGQMVTNIKENGKKIKDVDKDILIK